MIRSILIGWLISLLTVLSVTAQPSYEKTYKKAIASFDKGKTKKGFALLDKALVQNSDYRDARYARAYYHFTEENYQQAIPDLTFVLVRHPDDTAAYRYRGLSYVYTEDFENAEADLEKARALDSTDSGIYGELGYLYFQMNDLERAKSFFTQSIARQPNAFAYYYLAQTQYTAGDYTDALQSVEKNLSLNPKDAEAFRLKALIFLNTQRYADAIKMYEQLLASGDIREPDDLLNWGLVYYAQKKYTQALTYFRTPKKHADAELHYYTGLAEYKLKNYLVARKEMDAAVALLTVDSEENAPLFYDRAVVRHTQGDLPGAVQDFLKSAYLLPEIVQQQDAVGDSVELLGNAVLLLKGNYTAYQLDSARAAGYRERAKTLSEVDGAGEEAIRFVNQALRLNRNDAEGYFIRAKSQLDQEKYAEALQDIEQAIQLRGKPGDDRYYHLRGLVRYELQQFDPAYADLSQAIATNPASAEYFYDRAYVAANQDNFTQAVADISQALALNPSPSDSVTYLLARAGFYTGQNQPDNVIADCSAVLDYEPDNAQALYLRGAAYVALKKFSEAITDLNKALRIEPDFPEARTALREAQRQGK